MMKKFLLKLIGFSLLLLVIGIVLWFFKGDSISNNAFISKKIESLEKKPEVNMVFIGSSKINNQVNPEVIDHVVPGVRSYNLGANASFNLENFKIIDELLKKRNIPIKYLVLELQDKIELTQKNLSTEASFSLLSPNNLKFVVEYQLHNRNYKQLFFALYSTILNVLHFKNEVAEYKDNRFLPYIEKNGFIPLDADLGTKQRNDDLLKNPSVIEVRKQFFLNDDRFYAINTVFIEKIIEMEALCKSKNIQLILLLPAPAEPDAKILLQYTNIRDIPVISFLDPVENPEFYLLENRWDYGHLNEKGANLLSEKIGLKLTEILK